MYKLTLRESISFKFTLITGTRNAVAKYGWRREQVFSLPYSMSPDHESLSLCTMTRDDRALDASFNRETTEKRELITFICSDVLTISSDFLAFLCKLNFMLTLVHFLVTPLSTNSDSILFQIRKCFLWACCVKWCLKNKQQQKNLIRFTSLSTTSVWWLWTK